MSNPRSLPWIPEVQWSLFPAPFVLQLGVSMKSKWRGGGSSPISHPLLSIPKQLIWLWSLQCSHRGFARSHCSDVAVELEQLVAFLCPYKYLHCCSCKSKFAWTPLCVVNFGLSTSHYLCCCVFIKTSITRLYPAQWEAILFLIAFLKQTKTGKKTSLKYPIRNHSWFKISHIRKWRCSSTTRKDSHFRKSKCVRRSF